MALPGSPHNGTAGSAQLPGNNEAVAPDFGKWCDMFAEYRNFYNFKTKRCLFEEKKEVSLMDL